MTLSPLAADGNPFCVGGLVGIGLWCAGQSRHFLHFLEGALEAGQKYPIVMEYFFNAGSAVAQLSWESPHTPAQIIPAGALSLLWRAHGPNPTHRAVNVSHAPVLTWNAGESAAQHDVYFGDDPNAVAGATTAGAIVADRHGTRPPSIRIFWSGIRPIIGVSMR